MDVTETGLRRCPRTHRG